MNKLLAKIFVPSTTQVLSELGISQIRRLKPTLRNSEKISSPYRCWFRIQGSVTGFVIISIELPILNLLKIKKLRDPEELTKAFAKLIFLEAKPLLERIKDKAAISEPQFMEDRKKVFPIDIEADSLILPIAFKDGSNIQIEIVIANSDSSGGQKEFTSHFSKESKKILLLAIEHIGFFLNCDWLAFARDFSISEQSALTPIKQKFAESNFKGHGPAQFTKLEKSEDRYTVGFKFNHEDQEYIFTILYQMKGQKFIFQGIKWMNESAFLDEDESQDPDTDASSENKESPEETTSADNNIGEAENSSEATSEEEAPKEEAAETEAS